MKNYIGFVNDHSGSMASGGKSKAALKDYNVMIDTVKAAASREMLDTVVSVVAVGVGFGSGPGRYSGDGYGCKREVTISNPHVLKPKTSWSTDGGTPLWDGIGNMIELLESLPDADDPNVSFLISTTTDGQEEHSSKYSTASLSAKIAEKQRTGRWTFVFRVPKGHKSQITRLGVSPDNIQEWDNTAAGMAASTAQTTAAVDSFYSMRSSGVKSSNVFYANAGSVNTSSLVDISSKVSLYVVPDNQMGIMIKDFILTKRMEYLIGAAFYQLTKTEARVTPSKLILIREKSTGKVFAGPDARKMIGLSTVNNARLHPGDHGNFDIFIQSESVNRKLVGGTGVLYWAEKGRPMTEADLAYLQPKAPAAPAVVQLPSVAPTNKPTPSPIPVAKKPAGPTFNGKPILLFLTREDARVYARATGKSALDLIALGGGLIDGKRWFVYQ